MTSASRLQRHDGLFWAAVVVCSCLLVAAQWSVPYLPTNDGPQHVLTGHIENHYLPGSIYVAQLVPSLRVTYYGFDALFAPLESVLGWQHALRASLSVITLGFAWGFTALALALWRERRMAALLGFPLALSWHLYAGFFAFLAASALGLWLLAFAVRPRRGLIPGVVLGAGLLIQALAHSFALALTLPVLLALRFFTVAGAGASFKARCVAASRVGLLALPALLVSVLTPLMRSSTGIPLTDTTTWLSTSELVQQLPRVMFPGPAARAWVGVLLLLGLVLHALRRPRGGEGEASRILFGCGLVLLLAALLLPWNIRGWQFFSPRVLPLGLALVFLSIGRLSLRAGGVVAVGVLLWLGSSVVFHRQLARQLDDAISGLFAPVKRSGMVLPVVLNASGALPAEPNRSPLPHVSPLLHLPAVYAAAQGGLIPYLFQDAAATGLVARRPPGVSVPVPSVERYWNRLGLADLLLSEAERLELQRELAWYGMHYEGLILLGARPTDLRVWREFGYASDYQRGSVLLARFTGCSVELDASGLVPGTKGLRLRASAPAVRPLDFDRDTDRGARAQGAWRLEHLPCANVAWSPYVELDGVTGLSPGDRRCREADATGRLRSARLVDVGWTLSCTF